MTCGAGRNAAEAPSRRCTQTQGAPAQGVVSWAVTEYAKRLLWRTAAVPWYGRKPADQDHALASEPGFDGAVAGGGGAEVMPVCHGPNPCFEVLEKQPENGLALALRRAQTASDLARPMRLPKALECSRQSCVSGTHHSPAHVAPDGALPVSLAVLQRCQPYGHPVTWRPPGSNFNPPASAEYCARETP